MIAIDAIRFIENLCEGSQFGVHDKLFCRLYLYCVKLYAMIHACYFRGASIMVKLTQFDEYMAHLCEGLGYAQGEFALPRIPSEIIELIPQAGQREAFAV